MFQIKWMKGQSQSPVETETSALTDQAEVIASARNRAPQVARLHPGNEPDRFRLSTATGEVIGDFPITK
jgi:hypothetical protein